MIHTTSISKLRNYPNATKFAIVRSLKREIKDVEQLAILSPSKELFWDYCDWKKNGIWNIQTFNLKYRPRFLAEMTSPYARMMLEELAERSHNEEIVLACFCPDINLCHRKIIVSLLRELNASIGDIN